MPVADVADMSLAAEAIGGLGIAAGGLFGALFNLEKQNGAKLQQQVSEVQQQVQELQTQLALSQQQLQQEQQVRRSQGSWVCRHTTLLTHTLSAPAHPFAHTPRTPCNCRRINTLSLTHPTPQPINNQARKEAEEWRPRLDAAQTELFKLERALELKVREVMTSGSTDSTQLVLQLPRLLGGSKTGC